MCLTYIPLLKYRTFTMLVFIPEFVNTFLSTLLSLYPLQEAG